MTIQPAANPGDLRSLLDVESLGLKRKAGEVLRAIITRGYTSPDELTSIISIKLARNKAQLTTTVLWLRRFLEGQGVVVLPNTASKQVERTPTKSTPKTVTTKVLPTEKRDTDSDLPEADILERDEVFAAFLSDGDILIPYLHEIRQYPLLSKAEMFELGRRIAVENDLEARNQLVVHNLRLVTWTAKRFLGRGVEYADLVQEGNIGLIIAAERFDYSLGFTFGTLDK